MAHAYDHSSYVRPLSWRYGSEEMKEIFSEVHKRKLLRRVWIALARAEAKAGIVRMDQEWSGKLFLENCWVIAG